jgi:hypothetical protein
MKKATGPICIAIARAVMTITAGASRLFRPMSIEALVLRERD